MRRGVNPSNAKHGTELVDDERIWQYQLGDITSEPTLTASKLRQKTSFITCQKDI
jgi:hypothetical protein